MREVIESDIKSTARRNGVSEQEIETMLKEMGKELRKNPPKGLKKLGIDEIAIVKGQKNYYKDTASETLIISKSELGWIRFSQLSFTY
ncbi:MAG: hypothetical protein AB4290_18755 [Spirulina sp.]